MALLTTKIYLDNLVFNYKNLQKKSSDLAAIVKADAYGLGAIEITKSLLNVGCQKFFVATAHEGKILRQLFPHIHIYVFDGLIETKILVDYNLRPVLNTIEQLNSYIKKQHLSGAILHIDTGMNRLGILMSQISDIDRKMLKNCQIDYIMTHFSDAESDQEKTQNQMELLFNVADSLNIQAVSYNNSAGILNAKNQKISCLNRAGIALYGGIDHTDLRPVVSVEGKILQFKTIPKNQSVGYGSAYITDRTTHMITVAGGYGDGISRNLSHSDYCGYLDGYHVPLIGRVSMDSTMFDVSHISQKAIRHIINNNMPLEFFGLNQSITYISKCAQTISYEFLVNLSKRHLFNYI